jgi:putative membrane protein
MRQIERFASLALAGCLTVALAAPAGGQAPGGRAGEAITDAQFAELASASDLAEINLGRMAAKQASNPDVKKFAEQLVADHTKSSKEMLKIANKQGFRLAPRMDAKHQALATKLLSLKGGEFDRQFMKDQVMAHETAIRVFKAEASNGKDAELKAFAAKTLPHLEKHLKTAQEINNKLTGGGAGGR